MTYNENNDLNKYIIRKKYNVTFDIDTTEHDKEIYNQAIDEYKNSIKEELNRFEVKNLDTCVLFDLMDRKAEKMKAGGINA